MADAAEEDGQPLSEAPLGDYLRLLKPRVMSLAIFTALVAMVVAPGTTPLAVGMASIFCIAAGAGAAGALNMWWDADIDQRMARTAGRPAAAGRISPDVARNLGLGLSGFSCVLLGLFANWLAAFLLALTILHYVVVYTIYLKRRTPHNVVIGGIAGALPPMIGWAAATGSLSPVALLMFATIFLWTPPHSWALAMAQNADYARAGVPMMPAVAGSKSTWRQIMLYTLATFGFGILLGLTPVGGPLTLAVAVLLGLLMIEAAWGVGREAAGRRAQWRLFGVSIIYLFALFAAILLESLFRDQLPGYGWQALL